MLGSKSSYITHSRTEAVMIIDVLESTWGSNKVFGGVYEGFNASGELLPSVAYFDRKSYITHGRNQSFEWPFRCLDEATKLHHNCKTSPFSVFSIHKYPLPCDAGQRIGKHS